MLTTDKTITKESLTDLVQKWGTSTFGIDFKYRPLQKECIVDIIWNWFNSHEDVILDAPTGSGKSFIAMAVAGVLSTYFGKKGYVLISDLSLLQQYANDLELYLPHWGVLRGQQTYTCAVNGFNFSVGACKLQGYKTYSEIISNCQECASYCEYLLAREKAMSAKVTVCTYTYWLLQQNFIRPRLKENAPFEKRDFVICDEAHKLLDIVQNHFSPRFSREDMTKISLVIDRMRIEKKEELKLAIRSQRDQIRDTEDNKMLLEILDAYSSNIAKLAEQVEAIKNSISKDGKIVSKNDRTLLNACEFVKEHYSKFNEYVSIIRSAGPDYLVKNAQQNSETIVFNCLNESYLMKRAFHNNAGVKLYMSATIGDPVAYSTEIAISDYHHIKLPSVFDYSQSPIYYVNDYKMSYHEKDSSFPRIVEMIEGILTLYPNKRGIVQTGSYQFAKILLDMISPKFKKRLLLYDDSRDKQEKLDDFKFSSNKVLVGPSLTEGLSLNDELCRFQIIMKVPYPSLADKYVAAKSKFNPKWYSNATAITLLQGVGRGIRSSTDWCVTFILDACFGTLYSNCSKMFEGDFMNRIQLIPGQSLVIK